MRKTSRWPGLLLAAAVLAAQIQTVVPAEGYFEIEGSDPYADDGDQADYTDETQGDGLDGAQGSFEDGSVEFDTEEEPQQEPVQEQTDPYQAQQIAEGQPEAATQAPEMVVEATTETTTAQQAASVSMSVDDVQNMNGGLAIIESRDDKVTFIDGTFYDGQVTDFTTAAAALQRVYRLLGISPDTVLMQYGAMSDSFGNIIYRFQQIQSQTNTPIRQGVVKLYTDNTGHVNGASSSVAGYVIPQEGDAITGAEAETAVIHYMASRGWVNIPVYADRTEMVLAPNFVSDQKNVPMLNMWVVYTWNPKVLDDPDCDMPFLAHYVNTSGEYRYSVPCFLPTEKVTATSTTPDSYFEGMVSGTWTGTVVRNDGTAVELTVPVMSSVTTGHYYLADPIRKIAVADCSDFLYRQGTVTLEEKEVNDGWDPQVVLAYASAIQSYDFYKGIGFRGADVTGTPTLLLKNFCAADGTPVNKAVYAGRILGWQTFAFGSEGAFGQALDMIAHAYTHAVAEILQSTGLYLNDFGAAIEAVCDILGNVVEMSSGRTADVSWMVGERTGTSLRCLSNPESGGHPSVKGGLYYEPNINRPYDFNRWGGTFADSSLVGLVAFRLYEAGMTIDQCRGFWTTVLSVLNPGTDDQQLTYLLPWALNRAGLTDYQGTLYAAMEETQLGYLYQPGQQPEDGCALINMYFPLESFLAVDEPVLILTSADGQETVFRDWTNELGAMGFQVLPGSYTAKLMYMDNSLGEVATWSYDGQKWFFGDASVVQTDVETDETVASDGTGESLAPADTGQTAQGVISVAVGDILEVPVTGLV